MRYVFNAIFVCFFAGLALIVDAQTVNQGVNWGSALSSCSRERDISDRLAAKVRGMNYGHRDSREIVDVYKRYYFPDLQLMDRLNDKMLSLQGEVKGYKEAVDRVRNNEQFYYPTAANLAGAELEMCLVGAGLQQARQSVSSSSAQQQAPVRSGNQEGSAKIDVNQSIALAQQNQAKAEEKRKRDGRRRNRPDLEASSCLTPNTSKPGFSGFTNNCSHLVRYTYCVVNPSVGTGAAFVDCSKMSGAGSVPANGEDFAHMKGGTEVHWVGCRPPATAITRRFENGRLTADCIDLGA